MNMEVIYMDPNRVLCECYLDTCSTNIVMPWWFYGVVMALNMELETLDIRVVNHGHERPQDKVLFECDAFLIIHLNGGEHDN